jgi:AbrB family looped-hinge helix DNA binding protein
VARVTSKLQVTIPKAIADRFGIRPGDDLDWVPAGEAIRVIPAAAESVPADPRRRLELFDAATARQQARDEVGGQGPRSTAGRGWRREDLYERGRAG